MVLMVKTGWIEKFTVEESSLVTGDLIQKKSLEITTLLQSSAIMDLTVDLAETFKQIFDLAKRVIKFDKGIIFILDEENRLEMGFSQGFLEEELKKLDSLREMGEWLKEGGRPIHIPDLGQEGECPDDLKEMGIKSMVLAPISLGSKVKGVMALLTTLPHTFALEDLGVLSILSSRAAITIENAKLFEKTRRLAITDGLTGLYNYRFFDQQLGREIERAERGGRPLALLMLDIDNFKQFNDQRGHLKGDRLLQDMAKLFCQNQRQIDTVARYGGDEFSVILPDTDREGALKLAHRLRSLTENYNFGKEEGEVLHFTVSMGLAIYPENTRKKEELINMADQALYHAKRRGRNSICLFSEIRSLAKGEEERFKVKIPPLEMGQALSSILDLDELLSFLVVSISNSLDVERCSVMLLKPDTDKLVIKRAKNLDEDIIRRTEVKLGEGIAGRVALEGRPLLVRDVEKELAGGERNRYRNKSFILVPLKTDGQVKGVINITERRSDLPFTSEDLDWLSQVAEQVSINLERIRIFEKVERNYLTSLCSLVDDWEAKIPYFSGHSKRVVRYALEIAQELGLTGGEIENLRYAAGLHDIGTLGMGYTFLLKPDLLSEEEAQIMKEHPLIGERIVTPIRSLPTLKSTIRHHHEWYNGNGYPDGIEGDSLPLLARILTVADAFDALTSKRPYRRNLNIEEAILELKRNSGTQFDKKLVDVFTKRIVLG